MSSLIVTITKLYFSRLVNPLLLFLFFLVPFWGNASHIVGGEIGYRCLGNNRYEVRLSIYRDCFYGGDDAPFDDPASVGIFNARTGRFIQELMMPLVADDTLTGIFQDDCLMIPEDVCVHTATYLDTVTLQFIEDGYHLVYQRCCRNQTIANIVNPLETGATYEIVLTAEGMRTCNSTPRFKEWPPIFICVGKPVFYDHGAVDPDGDRLVYKLCTPFTGANSDFPKPQPPAAPPYDTLAWVAPTYNLNNVLGAGRPLAVDERSGFLFARPELQGQFVVGVCVEEYRDNKLLSVTRRDFQYNIGMCAEIGARVSAPQIQCNDLTVNFESFSTNSDDFIWNFNYPNTPITSLEENPTYTFPDTGKYIVQLVVEPKSICSDTMYHEIVLRNNTLDASFLTQSFDCGDSSVVTLIDQSIDNISSIKAWFWEVSYGDTMLTFDIQQPSFFVKKGISGTIRMTVESENGCTQTLESVFETGNNDPTLLIPDEITICKGDSVFLNPLTDPNNSAVFRWRPAIGIDNPNIPNPKVSPKDSTVYTARIIAANNLCSVEKEVVVNVNSTPELTDFQYASDCFDGLKLNFKATLDGVDSLGWHFGDTASDQFQQLGLEATHTFADTGTFFIRIAVAQGACTDTILAQEIRLQDRQGQSNITLDAGPDLTTCAPKVALQATAQGVFQYVWLNAQDSIIGENGSIEVPVNGNTFYRVVAEDLAGCTVEDTIRISGKPVAFEVQGDTLLCTGAPLNIKAINLTPNSDSLAFRWFPAEGILAGAETAEPLFDMLPGFRTFKVLATNEFNCRDSAAVNLQIINSNINLSFDTEVQCDNATVLFMNTSSDSTINYRWLFGDAAQSSATSDSILFNYPDSGRFNACLTIDYNVACADTTCKMLDINNTMIGADFSVSNTNCSMDSTTLVFQNRSTGVNANATYLWEFSDSTFSTLQNPTKTFYESQRIGVKLTILTGDSCQLFKADSIDVVVLSIATDTLVNLCRGNQVLLNARANPTYAYTWSPSESLSANNVPSPLATPTQTTTYQVVISDPQNEQCQIVETITVAVSDGLVLGVPDVLNICGQATPISVADNLNAYVTWTNDLGQTVVGNNIIIPADYTGTYLVEAVDAIGCLGTQRITVKNENGLNIIKPIGDTILTCENQTVLIILENGNPTDEIDIAYFPNDRITQGDSTLRPTFFGFKDTIMTLNYKARNQFGCVLQDSLIIKIRDFEINLPAEAKVCPNAPSTINPNFNPQFTYQWSPNTGLSDPNVANPEITITQPTTYRVTVTVGIGGGACRDERPVKVDLFPNTVLTASRDTVVCIPSLITLEANASRAVTYRWSDQADFSEIMSTDSTFAFQTEEGVQTIYVSVQDTFGCQKTAFTAISTLPVSLSLPDTTSSCFANELTLNATNIGIEQRIDYVWSPEVLLISGQGTANPVIQPANNTLITAIGTNRFGCADTIQTFLSLIDLNSDKISITADPDTIFAGKSAQLNIDLEGQFFYQWLPSNTLDNPNIKNPIATPTETTTYTVEITQANCVGIQSVEVVVNSGICNEPYIFVPLAFTPNQDGTNDVLYVRGNPIEQLYFAVYNRWGQKVFETTDKNIGWDGTFKGRKLAPDVFAYYLEVTCTNGETYFRKGDVTILK